jgi:hypothetical protein
MINCTCYSRITEDPADDHNQNQIFLVAMPSPAFSVFVVPFI